MVSVSYLKKQNKNPPDVSDDFALSFRSPRPKALKLFGGEETPHSDCNP